MKLSETIKNFDPNKSELAPIDYDAFMENLNIQGHFKYHEEDEFLKYFKAYYVQKRMSTDTVVGIIFYFFKDKFVCMTTQSGRGSDLLFEWKNSKSYETIRTYFHCFVERYEFKINIIDLDDEIEEFYELTYASEIMETEAYLNDEIVQIVDYDYRNSRYVEVQRKNGIKGTVFVSDLRFKSKGF